MTQPTYTLTPEDGRKGAAATNARRNERKAELARRSEIVWRIVDETEDLSPAALAASLTLIERLSVDPDADPLAVLRLANAAEIVHRISRLASNQSTSNSATQRVLSDEERRELMARMRGQVAGTSVPRDD